MEPLAGDQVFPAGGLGTAGGFIIWQDAKIDTQGQGIGGLRLGSTFLAEGEPFRINQRVAGHQQHPSIALLADSGAIVAWDGGVKGDSDIFARFLRPDGTFLTGDLQVNPTLVTGRSNYFFSVRGYKANRLRNLRFRLSNSYRVIRDKNVGASVAALADGGAVVAYTGLRRVQTNWTQIVTNERTLRGRTYTNTVPIKVSAYNDWMQDVFIQRFDSRGRKVGGEVLVNEYTKYNQRHASVAALPGGGFVVVYVSESGVLNLPNLIVSAGANVKIADQDVFARMFSATGDPLGHEFKVNTAGRPCATPVVSALSDGRFTVAWAQRDASRTNSWDVQARSFSAAGAPAVEAYGVNTHTYGHQFAPKIASAGLNQFVVWTSLAQDGSREGVFGRLLSGGLPAGGEVGVNSSIESSQIHPAVTSDGAGRFLAMWTTFNIGTSFDLNSQQYDTVQPAGANLAAAGQNAGAAGAGSGGGGGSTPGAGGAGSAGNTDANLRVIWSGPVGKLRLNWSTAAGASYQVQTSPDLRNWINFGPLRSAAGADDSIGVDVGETNGFFRVMRVP